MYKPGEGGSPRQASGGPPPRNQGWCPGRAQKITFSAIFDRFYKVFIFPPQTLDLEGAIPSPEFAVFRRFYKVFYVPPPRHRHPHHSPCRPKPGFSNGFQAFSMISPPRHWHRIIRHVAQKLVLVIVSKLFPGFEIYFLSGQKKVWTKKRSRDPWLWPLPDPVFTSPIRQNVVLLRVFQLF